MPKRTTVVVSQTQSGHPAKRDLEESIVTELLMTPGVEVVVVPNLYDLKPDGTGVLALSGIGGDFVLCSWLFERAAHWTLDRFGIRGRVGETLLAAGEDDDEEDADEPEDADEGEKDRVIDQRKLPDRTIYHLDLRVHNSPAPYLEEIKRIAAESSVQVVGLGDWIGGSPRPEQMQRYLRPANDTAAALPAGNAGGNGNGHAGPSPGGVQPMRVEEQAGRRWYPVIDFSRCTNCMECIDFCLFGVYGVDSAETILVEQPDNCRKGCPACSRVCPENAIVFPQHKTPAIAGSPEVSAGLKIDLSKLFGAPEAGEDAVDAAVRERDEQLVLAGRAAVGAAVGIPKRQSEKGDEPRDELDDLVDALDDLDL